MKIPVAPSDTPRTAIIAMRNNGKTDAEIAKLVSAATGMDTYTATIWRVRTGRSYPRRKLEAVLMKLAKKYGRSDG